MTSAFGPLTPWATAGVDYAAWDANADRWELYDLTHDYSQAHDLAAEQPERLEAMKARFLKVAKENKVFPVGAGLWLRIHPEDRIASPYRSWIFDATTTRMPEFTAPGLGRQSSHVTIDAEIDENASGALHALGGSSAELVLYMDHGELVHEYNMLLIERYEARAAEPVPAGRRVIEVATTIERPGAPADVVLSVDGTEATRTKVACTAPAAFTASETFDVGVDLGAPVSRNYAERRPFAFTGAIESVRVEVE